MLHSWFKATLDHSLQTNLYQQTLERWHKSAHYQSTESHMTEYPLFEQWANEAYIKRHIDQIISHLNSHTDQVSNLEASAEAIKPLLKAFILDAGFLSASEKAFMSRHDFIDASLDFIKKAQQEDAELSLENLGQALRNFWIANLLQSIFLKPVKLNAALYGYSMLYPYTDNLMDDEAATPQSKLAFCSRLSDTLELYGKSSWTESDALNESELRIHALCQLIYEDYDRQEQERVYFGLKWIHEAQQESLKQQQPHLLPYEMDILKLSFNKGGASLIADALLVEPDLSQEALSFCFHLGAVLQLCDDLQDTCSDALLGHQTIFSQLKDHYVFDRLLSHLLSFTSDLMTSAQVADIKALDLVESVLIPNTHLLLLASAMFNEQLFSRHWINAHKKYLPVSARGMLRLQKHFKKKLKRTAFGKIPQGAKALSFKELSKAASY